MIKKHEPGQTFISWCVSPCDCSDVSLLNSVLSQAFSESFGISASQPVLDTNGAAVGVASVDFNLDVFSETLARIATASSSDLVLFVMTESDGALAAVSVGTQFIYDISDVTLDDGTTTRIISKVFAAECKEPAVAAAALFFSSKNRSEGQLYIEDNRFLLALPISDGLLRWTLVTSVSTACLAGFYPDIEHATCSQCPWPTTSTANSTGCDCCLQGFYWKKSICKACPENAICPGGQLQPRPVAGYWGDPESPLMDEFRICTPLSACPGAFD